MNISLALNFPVKYLNLFLHKKYNLKKRRTFFYHIFAKVKINCRFRNLINDKKNIVCCKLRKKNRIPSGIIF